MIFILNERLFPSVTLRMNSHVLSKKQNSNDAQNFCTVFAHRKNIMKKFDWLQEGDKARFLWVRCLIFLFLSLYCRCYALSKKNFFVVLFNHTHIHFSDDIKSDQRGREVMDFSKKHRFPTAVQCEVGQSRSQACWQDSWCQKTQKLRFQFSRLIEGQVAKDWNQPKMQVDEIFITIPPLHQSAGHFICAKITTLLGSSNLVSLSHPPARKKFVPLFVNGFSCARCFICKFCFSVLHEMPTCKDFQPWK